MVINYNEVAKPKNVSTNSIGIYFNTSGEFKQNPIRNLSVLTDEADLIIGVEVSKRTQSKYIEINDQKILKPYRETMVYNPNIKNGIYTQDL